jgi:hypothetical protein
MRGLFSLVFESWQRLRDFSGVRPTDYWIVLSNLSVGEIQDTFGELHVAATELNLLKNGQGHCGCGWLVGANRSAPIITPLGRCQEFSVDTPSSNEHNYL